MMENFVLFLGGAPIFDPTDLNFLQLNRDSNRLEGNREMNPFWQRITMPYHCPRCNAGYKYKKTLHTHMKYDCGQVPRFGCPYCPMRNKCSSNIYKHVRMRHPGQPVTILKN